MLQKIVRHATLDRNETILEVGAGTGNLTAEIQKDAGRVVAIEKDHRFIAVLEERFRHNRNVKIVEGDVLRIRLPIFDKVVASPPYNISSKLIFSLLRRKLKSITMVLQKEFALRLVADPGSAEYGRLTVALRHKANTHLLDFVPRTVFRPIPRVDSHIVRIIPKGDITSVNESFFGQTVRYLFSQRKRTLRGVLKRAANTSLGEPLDSFVETADLLEKRIFQLTTHEFEILSNYLYPRRKLFKLVTT